MTSVRSLLLLRSATMKLGQRRTRQEQQRRANIMAVVDPSSILFGCLWWSGQLLGTHCSHGWSLLGNSISAMQQRTTSSLNHAAAIKAATTTKTRRSATATDDLVEQPLLDENMAKVAATPVVLQKLSDNTKILADAPDFVKPDRDRRSYRVIQLANNLQVLLVSNPLAVGGVGTEAASVHVQAGHFDDTLPGLAHFHEHMLFLGTQKYPQEDEYERFLSQYGGFSNAYTDMEDTNYYFSVTTQQDNPNVTSTALNGALDRLAQFFIAPLFDAHMVDREVLAIDSEYRNGKTSDSWRHFQFLKSTCDAAHPFANFGCGNQETLKSQGATKLLEELRSFWETHYQTYNMRLAVVGHSSLDALQSTVEATFGALAASSGAPRRRDRSLPSQFFGREHAVYGQPGAFGPEQLGKINKVIPLTETRALKLYFATPPLDDPQLERSKPYRTISHLLGHESPGSLHAYLSDMGYINGLNCGTGIDVSDFSLFSLTLDLTPLGMERHDHVLDLVWEWIGLVKDAEPIMATYHDEIRLMSAVNFRFRENGDSTDFASAAAELLFDPPTNLHGQEEWPRLLIANAETSDYDALVTRTFLDRLRPDNCMITLINSGWNASDGEDWEQEPWYGAKYRVEEVTAEQQKRWANIRSDAPLKIPALNEYIPVDFTLRCDDDANAAVSDAADHSAPPTVLLDRPNLRMWHKMDSHWRVPKAYIRLSLLTPDIYSSPRSMSYNRIFERVLGDDLNSFVYDASVAGCFYKVVCTPSGYRITVRGYSEKLPFLLDTLTTRIRSLIGEMKSGDEVLRRKFNKAKEALLRETKNFKLDQPYEMANYNSRLLMEESVWYLDHYIAEMESKENPMTLEECARVAETSLMGRVKAEALCIGNLNTKEAIRVSNVIDDHFLQNKRPPLDVEMPHYRSMKLPTKTEARAIFGPSFESKSVPVVFQALAGSESEENNAMELIVQVGSELELGYEGVALLDLLTHMAYNSAFNQLRTKEQLGYIVSALARRTAGATWAMSIVVQSSVALPRALQERSEAWLVKFRDELQAMKPEAVAAEASAVVAQLLEQETKLSQEAARIWGEILSTEALPQQLRKPAFDRLERLAKELTVEDDGIETQALTAESLQSKLLRLFDDHISAESPCRRAAAAHVYRHDAEESFKAGRGQPGVLSSFSDLQWLKLYLSTFPTAPYWRNENTSSLDNGWR